MREQYTNFAHSIEVLFRREKGNNALVVSYSLILRKESSTPNFSNVFEAYNYMYRYFSIYDYP